MSFRDPRGTPGLGPYPSAHSSNSIVDLFGTVSASAVLRRSDLFGFICFIE